MDLTRPYYLITQDWILIGVAPYLSYCSSSHVSHNFGGSAASLKIDIFMVNFAIISCCADNKEQKFQNVFCALCVE